MKTKRTLGLSLVSGAVLVAAGLGGPSWANAAKAQPVTVGLADIQTLDPAYNGPNVVIDEGLLFEGLYGFSPTYHLEKKIASGYTVSDGGKVWTFYLRHNARWSNGQPVTAQDFYYAWMRIASPAESSGLIWASVMQYVKNAWAYQAGQVPAQDVGVKVVNPYTIRLTLQSPADILPTLAISGSMPVYPPDVKEHGAKWYLPPYFVGDGPYVVKSFVPNGELDLVRNPHYVGAPGELNVGNVPALDIGQAPSVPVEDFLTGKLDLAMIGSTSDYHYVLTHPALKAQLHTSPDAAVVGLEWDHAVASSPLDNVLVRRAIAMAINRTPIVKDVLDGMALPATTMGPDALGAPKFEHAPPFNVREARKLLARAGYPGGRGIPELYLYTQTEASNPQQVSVAEALAQEFHSELGIRFKIDPLATTLANDIVYDGLNPGIKPGYVISWGSVSWPAPGYLTAQADQMAGYPLVLAGPKLRQYATQWYFPSYDQRDVTAFGNPADPSMGLKFSQWEALHAALLKDVAWLKAYNARQPKWYQAMQKAPAGQSSTDIWNSLVRQWQKAKTASAKHKLWVTAWDMVGTYSLGNGQTHLGLNGEVYELQHEPAAERTLYMNTEHLTVMTSVKQATPLAASTANLVMQEGWEEPLYLPEAIFLERSNLSGAVGNPYFWNGWEDFQYLRLK